MTFFISSFLGKLYTFLGDEFSDFCNAIANSCVKMTKTTRRIGDFRKIQMKFIERAEVLARMMRQLLVKNAACDENGNYVFVGCRFHPMMRVLTHLPLLMRYMVQANSYCSPSKRHRSAYPKYRAKNAIFFFPTIFNCFGGSR